MMRGIAPPFTPYASPGAAVEDLLAAVTARPDDDAPRLACADALAARRPDRAELIRLQVERSRDERARGVVTPRPSPRELALLEAFGADWARHVDPFVRARGLPRPDPGWRFDRGFVAYVRVDPDTFIGLDLQLFALAPIQHVDIVADQPVRPVLDSPLLERLDSLGLRGAGLDDGDAEALAGNPYLRRMAWLDLRDNRFSHRGRATLMSSPQIRRIPHLFLDGAATAAVVADRFLARGSAAS